MLLMTILRGPQEQVVTVDLSTWRNDEQGLSACGQSYSLSRSTNTVGDRMNHNNSVNDNHVEKRSDKTLIRKQVEVNARDEGSEQIQGDLLTTSCSGRPHSRSRYTTTTKY